MTGGKGLGKTHQTFEKNGPNCRDLPKIRTLPMEMKPVPMVPVAMVHGEQEVVGLQLHGPA